MLHIANTVAGKDTVFIRNIVNFTDKRIGIVIEGFCKAVLDAFKKRRGQGDNLIITDLENTGVDLGPGVFSDERQPQIDIVCRSIINDVLFLLFIPTGRRAETETGA